MSEILEKCEEFVVEHYSKNVDRNFSFHSLAHTRRTVKNVILIGENSGLSGDDLEVLTLAAWLHDCGISESYDDHEIKGVEIVNK